MILLQPTYFSPIIQFVAIAKSKNIVFETADNYLKQTYRTRCHIYGANGLLQLNVPIIHSKGPEQYKTKDVLIDNSYSWQKHHLKSLNSAYRSSPFFEFYVDDLIPLFESKNKYLLDLNIKTFELITELLQENIPYQKTTIFEKNPTNLKDLRSLVIAKNEPNYHLSKYTQVFDDKFGFMANLSILDLLFSEGPNTFNYLKNYNQ